MINHFSSIFNNFKFSRLNTTTNETIIYATDNWIKEVTINNDPEAVAKLFCKDGNLLGTVSRRIRTDADIKAYFNFFAKLPGIKVISKNYNITKVAPNVHINSALVQWYWNDLDKPIDTRMTFVFRHNLIFQLHSSVLPNINRRLVDISGSD
jgi:hypothetical protein